MFEKHECLKNNYNAKFTKSGFNSWKMPRLPTTTTYFIAPSSDIYILKNPNILSSTAFVASCIGGHSARRAQKERGRPFPKNSPCCLAAGFSSSSSSREWGNFQSNILPITQRPSWSSAEAAGEHFFNQALKEMRNGFFGPTRNYCSTVHYK